MRLLLVAILVVLTLELVVSRAAYDRYLGRARKRARNRCPPPSKVKCDQYAEIRCRHIGEKCKRGGTCCEDLGGHLMCHKPKRRRRLGRVGRRFRSFMRERN